MPRPSVIHERVYDRSVEGKGQIKKRSELTVRQDNATGFLGDDFHTAEVISRTPSLQLYLYGLASAVSRGALISGLEVTGGAYKRFMAKPDLNTLLVNVQALFY